MHANTTELPKRGQCRHPPAEARGIPAISPCFMDQYDSLLGLLAAEIGTALRKTVDDAPGAKFNLGCQYLVSLCQLRKGSMTVNLLCYRLYSRLRSQTQFKIFTLSFRAGTPGNAVPPGRAGPITERVLA